MVRAQSRRVFLVGSMAMGATLLAGQAGAQALGGSAARNNISAFRLVDWQDNFDNLKGGVIIADTGTRFVQFWSEDESIYKIYPSSVPLSEDLTRLGYTEVIRNVEGPSWTPTPAMRLRNPEWPVFVPPGPDNPLGTHALYLSGEYYRIHGTHDTRKIRAIAFDCNACYRVNILRTNLSLSSRSLLPRGVEDAQRGVSASYAIPLPARSGGGRRTAV